MKNKPKVLQKHGILVKYKKQLEGLTPMMIAVEMVVEVMLF